MREQDIKAQAGLMDFLCTVVAAIIKVEPSRLAALVERGSKGFDHVLGVVTVEKLSVSNDSGGIINEGHKKSLSRRAITLFYRRSMHSVSLPKFIGKLHGKGLSKLVGGLGVEQVVLADHAIEL